MPSPSLPIALPPHAHCPPVLPSEISAVLSRCSASSAPGPDSIPYSAWKMVHVNSPRILPDLFSPLLKFAHLPASLKKANGVVLDKPGKPSYDSPSSFRIIVLLQTISKVVERLMALRIFSQARALGLLHPNQCGSLPGLSSFDACLSLTDTVRTLQRPGLKVSSLFVDIKGGFDNVRPKVLCSSLARKGLPSYMVSWVASFLTDRTCRLLFQGSPKIFAPVSVGTPQGSPISPLLFVIYVSSLHFSIPNGLVLSYVDDFALTVASPSYRSNVRLLQRSFAQLKSLAAPKGVSFSIPKTELIHWRTRLQRDKPGAPRPPPISLDGQLFHPAKCLRWLGYWLHDNLASTSHFAKRLTLAQAAFAAIRRLSPHGSGIAPHLAHRLSISLILPTLLYGADLLTPNVSMVSRMEVFWRQVQRWVTNCFRSTPVSILAAEACLPPIAALLPHKRRMAALRLVCSPPTVNPAAGRLCPSFPSLLGGRAPDSHRDLCTRLPPNVMPLKWYTDLPKPPMRTHLPVDSLANAVVPLLEGLDFAPLPFPHLLPNPEGLPSAESQRAIYNSLRAKASRLLLADWNRLQPPPSYYTFPLGLRPHPFMGLGKFIAGRLHQMRAQKSYLAAHRSWSDMEASMLCPRCREENETFSHAILRCPSRAPPRARLLQGVSEVGPDAPCWTSVPLLLSIASYIRTTHTNFPPDMFACPSPASSASSVVAPSPLLEPLQGLLDPLSSLRPV